MKIRAFITHKKAEHFGDCQDRFRINQDTKSVAVADGMSQSYQQKIWASLLVEKYVNTVNFVPNNESIRELSAYWHSMVISFINDLKEKNAPPYLIIMNENSLALQNSAGATFLGIRFEGQKWKGDVLGDSSLIEIKDGNIGRILTSQPESEFDNYPDYFDSNPNKTGKGTSKPIEGILDDRTFIMLVSDPFSDFLNEKKKEGNEQEFVSEIMQLTNHQDFESLVARWRDEYDMHNDDSTLVIIEYDGADDLRVFQDHAGRQPNRECGDGPFQEWGWHCNFRRLHHRHVFGRRLHKCRESFDGSPCHPEFQGRLESGPEVRRQGQSSEV